MLTNIDKLDYSKCADRLDNSERLDVSECDSDSLDQRCPTGGPRCLLQSLQNASIHTHTECTPLYCGPPLNGMKQLRPEVNIVGEPWSR